MGVASFHTENTGQSQAGNAGRVPREFSFQHVATAILTAVGFVGLFNGLAHMMNGSWVFALVLSLKTGTPVNAYRFATDKIVTGSLVVGGHYYSYFFAVQAPNPAKYPLGKALSASHFAPMIDLLLKELPPLTRPTAKAASRMGTSTERHVQTNVQRQRGLNPGLAPG